MGLDHKRAIASPLIEGGIAMKAIKLFFTKPVQDKMKDQGFSSSPGFRRTIRLPSEVLELGLKESKNDLFEIYQEDSDRLKFAVRKAQRIEGTVWFDHFNDKFVELDIRFYQKAEKDPSLVLWFKIELSTAKGRPEVIVDND